ncbi:MAG: hypothetical protein GY705_01620 [Bacteroidetes bacterium]|nr:hypothetical protein [Bacteroidota bacterium]
MPRNFQRKTDRGLFTRETMLEGVRLVLNAGQKIKPTAKELGLNYKTLGRYVELKRNNADLENQHMGYSRLHRRIFNDKQEQILADYLLQASRIYFGLTMIEFKTLSFKFAKNNNIFTPTSWRKMGMASKDWASEFFKRHPVFSLRVPEATSIARMTSFNKTNVNAFYDNLDEVIQKYKFTPDRIYNCDETGVTTVQKPKRTIAEKGVKRIGAVVSQERGDLVTMCGTINATGNSIPPFCVFPRVNTQPLWEEVLPAGSKTEGHPRHTGWMTEDNFLSYLHHFKKYTRPSAEFPVLLLLDNHASHVSLDAINFCRDNHIIMLSFPPHCSHELQPLDKTVYGPFKTFFNEAADRWLRKPLNEARPMTIHTLPVLITEVYSKAFTPENILSGFKATGIQPFKRDAIPEERFLPSYFSDHPEPQPEVDTSTTTSTSTSVPLEVAIPSPSASTSTPSAVSSNENVRMVSPEEIRPFAKSAPRKKIVRKKAKSEVLTSTPFKRQLEEAALKRKRSKPAAAPKPKCKKNIFEATQPQPSSSSDSDVSDMDISSESELSLSAPEDSDNDNEEIQHPKVKQIDEGDYLLVKFPLKKAVKYYVGKVESTSIDDNTVDCLFLKRKPTKEGQFLFSFPDKLDASEVPGEDIVCKLQAPVSGGTARTGDFFSFNSRFINSFIYPIL